MVKGHQSSSLCCHGNSVCVGLGWKKIDESKLTDAKLLHWTGNGEERGVAIM